MRAFASSFHSWRNLERQEHVKVPHALTFPLAIVAEIGRPHGLTLAAEEETPDGPLGFDAVFISVLDSDCLAPAAKHFRVWGLPFRRCDRQPVGRYPLVWAGGQGLHNPRPFAPVADLIVVGDAEDPLPALLALWERHGNTEGFLSAAATVPGVFVPAHHDPREAVIVQSVSADIGITLRADIAVNHNGQRRVEIARGCQYKCTFCSLGWRTPVRENTAAEVIAAIQSSSRILHLQAGDAESHSGIAAIREALHAHGGRDNGWTGRLDTTLENPDVTVAGHKRYAFGVEGVSHRLRHAVGKGYLTDDRLVRDTVTFFGSIEGGRADRRARLDREENHIPDTRGRAAWHLIAGLPTERVTECMDLVRVLRGIDHAQRGRGRFNLALHWQPFQPLPGTPMQWCGAGLGARKHVEAMRAAESLTWLKVRQLAGRTDGKALVLTSLSRADERGANLLEAMADGIVSPEDAATITGSPYGDLEPDAPLPWDFVRQHHGRDVLRRAYDVMMGRLRGEDPGARRALPMLP